MHEASPLVQFVRGESVVLEASVSTLDPLELRLPLTTADRALE